jgi:hypothetical protein
MLGRKEISAFMAGRVSEVQADLDDLQASVDDAVEILEAVNSVTATREDLAQAVLDALDALGTEEEDEENGEGE